MKDPILKIRNKMKTILDLKYETKFILNSKIRLFLCCFLFLSQSIFGIEPAFVIQPDFSNKGSLLKSVFYVRDPNYSYRAENFFTELQNIPIQEVKNSTLGFGYDPVPYWLVFEIETKETLSKEFTLAFHYPHLDQIDLYYQGPEGLKGEFNTGDTLPFLSRPIENRLFLFPIPVEKKGKTRVVVRVLTEGAVSLSMTLYENKARIRETKYDLAKDAAFFGALAVMAFFNLFLYLGLKERYLLYYSFLILSVLLYQIILPGYAFEWFFQNQPTFINQLHLESIVLMMVFMALFLSSFLETKKSSSILNVFLKISLWAALVLGFLIPLLPGRYLIPFTSLFPLLQMTVIFLISFFKALRGDRKAIIFLTAWFFTLSGGIIFTLSRFGLFLKEGPAIPFLQTGIILSVLFLSLALSERIRTIRKEKEEIEEYAGKLEELSYIDPLTRIFNRRYFDEQIRLAWSRSARHHSPLSLLMIDVDFFKQYNDTYGHVEGDRALISVAREIRASLRRANDMVNRYGGEEFAVILPDTPIEGAVVVALNILEKVEALNIAHLKSHFSKLTVSIGISCNTEPSIRSVQDLIGIADKNLYDAKESGRNHIQH
ncbi:diguanylate cyclase [Leptospira stimsonii]|uniref:diguanylate cyclase n=1 Tax=Leptospira stimsonii TaxID=2202203 RepID=A0A4R9L9R4_9LEPT|nr:diguanylate cyclase [Leptospira stimsonii]RHX83521.1 diguanylate cyclase [Leptospira stimsonii]TGK20416.1 GGDEF domain-containing protein [Leptospira stimsonii]TGM21527.1 GGDEF domain-containing protein [Leptospira stimsonii]